MHLAELSVYNVQKGHAKQLLHMKIFDTLTPCVLIVPYTCCSGGNQLMPLQKQSHLQGTALLMPMKVPWSRGRNLHASLAADLPQPKMMSASPAGELRLTELKSFNCSSSKLPYGGRATVRIVVYTLGACNGCKHVKSHRLLPHHCLLEASWACPLVTGCLTPC